MKEEYGPYLLKENPFPAMATVNPRVTDMRVNGEIFCEEILSEEVASLREKIEKKTNLVYVTGQKFDLGIGKSALIVHEWRRLRNAQDSTSILVLCSDKDKPPDLALKVAGEWHEQGYLWKATHRLLSMFSQARDDARISPDSIDTMFNAYPLPPERLPLTLYTHVTSPERFARMFASWLASISMQLNSQFLEQFFGFYLDRPAELPARISKIRIRGMDPIDIYANLLEILFQSGFKINFVFLNQLEDAIKTVPVPRIAEFSLSMRRVLEAGRDKSVVVVTLHPDSEMKLNTPLAEHLVQLAPPDKAHKVEVLALEAAKRPKGAIELAAEYMNRFRDGVPNHPTFPLEANVIRYVAFLHQGNVRDILQQLHQCLKFGASNGNPIITMDFVLEHHEDTMGKYMNPDLYDEFCSKVLKA